MIAVIENPENTDRIARLKSSGAQFICIGFRPGAMRGDLRIEEDMFSDRDWVVFADLRAADLLLNVMEEGGADPFILDRLSVFASGEAVADRLRFSQVHSDVIPRKITPESEYRELADYCGGGHSLSGNRILVFHTGGKTCFPVAKLGDAGCKVECVRVDQDGGSTDGKTTALLKGGAFSRIHFFGPVDVYDLANLVSPEDPADVFEGARVTASEGSTIRALAERGVRARLIGIETLT